MPRGGSQCHAKAIRPPIIKSTLSATIDDNNDHDLTLDDDDDNNDNGDNGDTPLRFPFDCCVMSSSPFYVEIYNYL
jgi:hypothetical protein